jgi:hypothetical protein
MWKKDLKVADAMPDYETEERQAANGHDVLLSERGTE